MIKTGLEREVRKLSKKYGFELPPMQTIGYSEWKSVFEGPAAAKAMAGEEIIQNTISFAKRQATWFKKEKDIKWIKDYDQAKSKVSRFLTK